MARVTRRRKLGQHLEWHGSRIRVVVRVPPSLKGTLGAHLRKTLPTDSPAAAEVLKYSVIQELKTIIYEARHGTKDDPLLREALVMREALKSGEVESDIWYHAMDARVDELKRSEDARRVNMFTSVATGVATPMNALVDQFIADKELAPRTASAYRHGLKLLESWCAASGVAPVFEEITSKLAIRFVDEAFKARGADPGTANKSLTGISSYWQWMLEKEHLDPAKHQNVWQGKGKRVPKPKKHRIEEETDKRPFNDTEATTLIAGVKPAYLNDLCHVAALSGMRLSEMAALRVKHVKDGVFDVRLGKTESAQRKVPIHSKLEPLVARRTKGKRPDDYLFHELPEQKNAARGRGAPASQAFTRARRDLGVDDRAVGRRQSRIDFHSWRRWFIRKAGEALEKGTKGFTPWTIADVVGHSKDDEPLPLTMGLYPGPSGQVALTACVEAVKLPKASNEPRPK